MKKFLAVLGLVALVGFGMGMSEMNSAPDEALQSPIVLVQGKIISTGACAQLVTCVGGFTINLIGLPASYSVGDEVELKGKLGSAPTICAANFRTVKIGKIRLNPC